MRVEMERVEEVVGAHSTPERGALVRRSVRTYQPELIHRLYTHITLYVPYAHSSYGTVYVVLRAVGRCIVTE